MWNIVGSFIRPKPDMHKTLMPRVRVDSESVVTRVTGTCVCYD